MLLSLVLSCANTQTDASTSVEFQSCTEGESVVLVLSSMSYARRENGVAWGFNLDEHISDATDDEGCYKEDLIDPYGNAGVDNAFSALIPALEMTEAIALETLLQASINSGELLLIIEITGVQDWQHDECVSVGMYRAKGTPLVGTDGTLLDGQTFEKDLERPYSTVSNIPIVNGHLDAVPLNLELPVQVLDEFLDLYMTDGGLHIELDETGSATGYMGGAVPLHIFSYIIDLPDVNLPDEIAMLLNSAGDLHPDEEGQCQSLSVAFQYAGIPAHFYSDE